jgi:hypothetical protein
MINTPAASNSTAVKSNQKKFDNLSSDLIDSITKTLKEKMPSIEANMMINSNQHPKYLCIRLATGPQYYS